jgi:hypothetical protein
MIRFSFPRLFNFSSPGLLSAYFRHKNFPGYYYFGLASMALHRISDSPPDVWEKFASLSIAVFLLAFVLFPAGNPGGGKPAPIEAPAPILARVSRPQLAL